jgi:beta-galactosidase/beta-glucuronidase
MRNQKNTPSGPRLILVAFLAFIIFGCAQPTGLTTTPSDTLAAPTDTPYLTPAPVTPTARPTDLPVAQAWGSRQVLALDGSWQVLRVKSLDEPIPNSGWEDFQVPGILDGYNYERAWFQRKFEVSSGWQGQRLILHFGGVKYNSRILVNGQKVGGHFNGYDAFDVDISQAVKWGAANLLQVGVYDWTGVFSDSNFDLQPYGADLDALRIAPADRILAPIGGLFSYYGIWDSVTLKIVPATHIDSFFIQSSLSKNRLDVDLTITNSAQEPFSGRLSGRIFPWRGAGRDGNGQWSLQGQAVTSFPVQSISLAAGQTGTFRLTLEEPGLNAWTPFTPNLYVLEAGFDQPDSDAVRERFGWREFQVKAGDFYLNGNKVHLLAASWWPDGKTWTREQVITELQNTRAANVVAFRTHTQPWPEIWYEAADEVGLMMIPEGAIWNDDTSYRINDERFWKNYADHLSAMLQNLRNHPSVVMWSLENEFSGDRINDQTPLAEQRLADLGRLVKQLDPTRPITYESDGDPGGVSDVIGIHYPNEYPQYRLWPNDAYWLDKPRELTSGGGFFWDKQPFLWDHAKPIYIGEYMWEPSSDPSTHTVLMGDQAYSNYHYYAVQAKAFAWRMQILAYRYFGVNGHSPWTVQEEGALDESNPTWVAMRAMYRPLAAFLREYDTRFFAGEKVKRTVLLFNDSMQDRPSLDFHWGLFYDRQTLAQSSKSNSMDSGSQIERVIEMPMPEVTEHKRLTLNLTLAGSGLTTFQDNLIIDVYPRGWIFPGCSWHSLIHKISSVRSLNNPA